MPTTETLPRCRHCGAPLAGEKGRRHCPRCHPEKIATPLVQLDLFSSPAAESAPISAPVEQPVAEEAEEMPDQPGSLEDAGQSIGRRSEPMARKPPRGAIGYLVIAAGLLIVVGGLGWSGFQLWPRGPVERSIEQAIAALPHFVERTGAANPFDGVRVEADSSPAFADLNGDGALDLVIGCRSGDSRTFRNVGTATRPRFLRPAEDTYGLVPTDTDNTVAFADLRGTHLPDAVNAGTNGALSYFENRGVRARAAFVLVAPENDPLAVRANPAQSLDWRPVFADIDGDGDLDLFVGTRDGTVLMFENHGTPKKADFGVITRVNPFGLRRAGELLSLAFGDLDGDGDLDVIVANGAGELRYFENRGTVSQPKFLLMPPGALGLGNASREATVVLVDLDGDGDLDCVTGGADGRLRYFENLRTPTP